MDAKKAHLEYINSKGPFTLECNRVIFSDAEIKLLEKYGHWFGALTDGTLEPYNTEQKQFIEGALFRKEPDTEFEKLWFRYLKRKEIEGKFGNALNKTPELDDDTFYSRDMAKKLKSTMFRVMNENHKK